MSKQFYFKQFSLAQVHSLNVKTVCTEFHCQKSVLFQTIQLSISSHFSSIWPINRTLSGATTPSQSELGSDGNKRVVCIPQSSSIIGTSQSDCLVSYPGHSLEAGAEKLSVYSTTSANWAILEFDQMRFTF